MNIAKCANRKSTPQQEQRLSQLTFKTGKYCFINYLCSCDFLKTGEGHQNQYKHGKLNGSCRHEKFQSTHQN